MRNKRETDISRYTDKSADNGINEKSESGVKRFFKGLCKFLLTAFTI